MKTTVTFIFLLLSCAGHAAEYKQVQMEKSGITFVSTQMGVPVTGDFKKFSADVHLNPARPERGSAKIEIDVASIDAGSAEANEEVKGKNWFDASEFQKAGFVSSSVKALGEGKFEASGKLTIKGKTVEVRAPFAVTESGNVLNVEGVFTIKRLDFGIGSGLWSDTSVVANEVQIKFHLVLK